MRARSREIATLSLSMLDVIAGAMAAFLILVVILLPYYKQETVNQVAVIAELRQKAADAESARAAAENAAQAAQAEARLARAEAERQRSRAEELARQLGRTFLVLYVRWDTHDDVDLHLTDPSGAEFWWNNKILPGRPGELSEDNIVGPGNEVWEVRDAPPGDYRVDIRLFKIRDPRKPVTVKGRVFHRDGSELFREINLFQQDQREHIATIRVDGNGGVRLVP